METITNEEKAKEIMNKFYGNLMPHYTHNEVFDRCFRARYADILEAMQWKDEKFENENQELRHQIRLLIDAIDHAYLRLDGTYGDLSYEVSDQVKYIKSMQTKELEGRMEL